MEEIKKDSYKNQRRNHLMKIRIFTDGACSDNPGPGGWAAVFNTYNSCETISGNETKTTNNRMELMAVVRSYERIIFDLKYPELIDFELYSDSAYVVNAFTKGWLQKWARNDWKTTKGDDVKNKDLWERLLFLDNRARSMDIIIDMIKIKGHDGNTFNELVDKLAKEETAKAKTKCIGGQK